MSNRQSEWQDWPFEPLPILRALARHHVDYILVGGLAAVLQGFPLPTYDVDIVPAPGTENGDRLAAALADIGGMWTVAQPDSSVFTPYGYIDVRSRPAGFSGYREARRDAFPCVLEPGVEITTLSLRGILRSRIAAGNHSQLPALEAALELGSAAG